MSEKDYIHAVYVIGIILILAPLVQGLLFFIFQFDRSPMYASLTAGSFYASGLFQTAGFMMIFYVAYKRFVEGWKSRRVNRDTTK